MTVVKNQVRPLGVIINGRLKDKAGNGVNNQRIALWESADHGNTWDLARTAAGNPDTTGQSAGEPSQSGYYRFDVDVARQGVYLFRTIFSGGNRMLPECSNIGIINVQ